MLRIDFVSFLKGQILREFQNLQKFIIFRKKHDFEKGMHSYVSNIGFNRNPSKKAGLMCNIQSWFHAVRSSVTWPKVWWVRISYSHACVYLHILLVLRVCITWCSKTYLLPGLLVHCYDNEQKTTFPLAFKETGSASNKIGSFPISACAIYTISALR